MSRKRRLQKHSAAAVLSITKHWRIGKKHTGKKRNPSVKLPKLKQVKAKLHREFEGQIKSATVSQVPSGKYYVSILVETEHEELPHTDKNTGLDLGVKDLCITSDGTKSYFW